MMCKKIIFLLAIITFASSGWSQTVTIGTQIWSTKNLDVSTFRNGDPIPEAKTEEDWTKAGQNQQPAWCYYNNDPANGEKYGKLYNWYAVNDSRDIVPISFHIPSDQEWKILTYYLNGTSSKGAGSQLKSIDGFNDNKSTNESGFSGMPGGYRASSSKFHNIEYGGYWWSSTKQESDVLGHVFIRILFYGFDLVDRINDVGWNGYSIRYLK